MMLMTKVFEEGNKNRSLENGLDNPRLVSWQRWTLVPWRDQLANVGM